LWSIGAALQLIIEIVQVVTQPSLELEAGLVPMLVLAGIEICLIEIVLGKRLLEEITNTFQCFTP
jgi:hypothetical protein